MRVIANIPHPKISITIFSMNDKYQIKFEAGPMEQIFKIPHSEINGIEGITKMVDDVFLEKVFSTRLLRIKLAITNTITISTVATSASIKVADFIFFNTTISKQF